MTEQFVVPQIWFKKLLTKNNKPDVLVIQLLKELCDMAKKTFNQEVEISYGELKEEFNTCHKAIQRAIRYLESLCLCKRKFRHEHSRGNIMIIKMFLDNVEDLSTGGN